MGEAELLDMLAAETDRRTSTICDGVERLSKSGEADSKVVESLRVEVHGIKGAALMVGQHRLAQIGAWVEDTLADRIDSGVIDKDLGRTIVDYVKAIQDGAHAAAAGKDEPSSVGKALDSIGSG
jgi:chemotaxis protein histidine kinase CheA